MDNWEYLKKYQKGERKKIADVLEKARIQQAKLKKKLKGGKAI